MSDHDLAIETSGLTKRFGARAVVDDVALRVPRGVAFGYLGPNGAGKTTTIRLLLGLTRPSGGSMRLLGRSVPTEHEAALARVGALVKEPRFLRQLTGRENLRIVAALRGRAAAGRIDAALDQVGLAGKADERVSRYSLGMRQRLGVARCLLADPELLILDEPTNGLDPAGIIEFRQMVRDLAAEGRTVLLSSHLLDEVEKTCDWVAIVDRGHVVAQGPMTDLFARGPRAIVVRSGAPARAATVIARQPAVQSVQQEDGIVRATLGGAGAAEARAVASDLNRVLVDAGVPVFGIELPRASLEERFLEITSRLQEVRP
jgi:ABC-2 type transport system ATP-binding protein